MIRFRALTPLAVVFACSSGPAQGNEGGACYPNGTCNGGLTCLSNLCVNAAVDSGADVTTKDASTDVVTQDVDAAPTWTPSQLANLALWLDDTTGITASGSAIALWHDQTVNKNDVAGLVDAGMAPTLSKAALNGLDVATFTTGLGLSKDQPSNVDPTADFAMFVVARLSGSGGSGELLAHLSGSNQFNETGWMLDFSSTHATYTYASNGLTAGTTFVSPNGSYADAKFHIVGARRTSNQIVVSVDGQASSPTSFLAGAAVIGAPLYLGGGPLNGIFNGDVAEAIIVSGPLSDPDHTNLVSYFKSKFAL